MMIGLVIPAEQTGVMKEDLVLRQAYNRKKEHRIYGAGVRA